MGNTLDQVKAHTVDPIINLCVEGKIPLDQFETKLPFKSLHISEFEERVKRFVLPGDHQQVSLAQLKQSFKNDKSFRDLQVDGSILQQLLTSKFLQNNEIKESRKVQVVKKIRREIIVDGKVEVQEEVIHENSEQTQEGEIKEENPTVWIPGLMLLAVLYCRGTSYYRAKTFYELVKQGSGNTIHANEKEIHQLYPYLIHYATALIYHFHKVANKEEINEQEEEEEENRLGDVYVEVLREMLHAVFQSQSEISKDTFIERFEDSARNYLDAMSIREIVTERKSHLPVHPKPVTYQPQHQEPPKPKVEEVKQDPPQKPQKVKDEDEIPDDEAADEGKKKVVKKTTIIKKTTDINGETKTTVVKEEHHQEGDDHFSYKKEDPKDQKQGGLDIDII